MKRNDFVKMISVNNFTTLNYLLLFYQPYLQPFIMKKNIFILIIDKSNKKLPQDMLLILT